MTIIYAHRGARGYAPENTMAAFRLAAAMKANGIELDVQLTKDDHPVICHDETVDRTSNGRGLVKDLTLAEIQRLDFGSWFGKQFAGETAPALDEFLVWFRAASMELNVEIKNGPVHYDGIEEKVVRLIEKHDLVDRTIVSSFYHPSLLAVKKINPSLRTGALFCVRPIDPCRFAEETGADYLHCNRENLDEAWVREAIKRNLGINVWTVNTKEEYAFVKPLGVRGIFSDFIDRFADIQTKPNSS
jgi:glycerophosphoryl diester phosphodiesterase